MKASLYTLGCRLNQCESEALAQAFEKAGFTVPVKAEPCELYLVNTCTVTSKAEQKARRMIRLYCQQPRCRAVLVTGCYAQLNQDEIQGIDPKVVVLGGLQKSRLLELPAFIVSHPEEDLASACRLFVLSVQAEVRQAENPFGFDATRFTFHSRAYLKIQDGCDNNCYYCRVHIARGASVSLPKEEVVRRALELEKAGYHEIVLTGVNLTMYNHTTDGIGGLLEALLASLGPDIRLRFSSLEPDHIDSRFLQLIRDPRVQPHFHIPIQSGSDKVLKAVNRHYTASELAEVLRLIREARPGAFLACDVIAGLPEEGEEEFEDTYRFIRENLFSQLHVFPFSPRPGTPLFKSGNRPCEAVRDGRAARLRELSGELHGNYIRQQSGKEVEILLETLKDGYWEALSSNYLKVRIPDDGKHSRGDLVKVRFGTLAGNEDIIEARQV